jgi:predicted transcriptional regulator
MVKKLKSLRINDSHLAALTELAKREGETVSFLIQQAIREFLERKESQKKVGGAS